MTFRIAARIGAERVQSLVWEQGRLVDWVAGGTQYLLDCTVQPRSVSCAFPFDAACGSPSAEYAVIYVRRGTKGLVLKEGHIVREINRSFYFANAYEYPVCIARLSSGREVLIHCPDKYNRLEIEDVETGERLKRGESAATSSRTARRRSVVDEATSPARMLQGIRDSWPRPLRSKLVTHSYRINDGLGVGQEWHRREG